MTDYAEGEIIVLATLSQEVRALCPRTGERRVILDRDQMLGLNKDQMILYGNDFLDVAATLVPNGWLVEIEQSVELTSKQAPGIIDYFRGHADADWLPLRDAMRLARQELGGWAELKRWGGSR